MEHASVTYGAALFSLIVSSLALLSSWISPKQRRFPAVIAFTGIRYWFYTLNNNKLDAIVDNKIIVVVLNS